MFEVNKDKNKLKKLDSTTLKKLEIKEREHLQECIVSEPSCLGEELLIIQKEFSGFEQTNERLDLLALDKKGNLVIIENKLDDSGRDVVWQALKYGAYCSTLTKQKIIDIFKEYLNEQKDGEVEKIICNFLNLPVESVEKLVLNEDNSQRFILVAADFRIEVTSTVLWLNSNGINMQCIKVTPYNFDNKHLLNFNQIIPIPEAEEYIVRIESKSNEEKREKIAISKSNERQLKFWNKLLVYFKEKGNIPYQNVNAGGDNTLLGRAGLPGCAYWIVFVSSEVRVQFMMTGEKNKNKFIFDYLLTRKNEITNSFGFDLEWDKSDDRQSSKISYSKSFDSFNEENWDEMIQWLFEYISKLENAFSPIIPDIKKELNND